MVCCTKGCQIFTFVEYHSDYNPIFHILYIILLYLELNLFSLSLLYTLSMNIGLHNIPNINWTKSTFPDTQQFHKTCPILNNLYLEQWKVGGNQMQPHISPCIPLLVIFPWADQCLISQLTGHGREGRLFYSRMRAGYFTHELKLSFIHLCMCIEGGVEEEKKF